MNGVIFACYNFLLAILYIYFCESICYKPQSTAKDTPEFIRVWRGWGFVA